MGESSAKGVGFVSIGPAMYWGPFYAHMICGTRACGREPRVKHKPWA